MLAPSLSTNCSNVEAASPLAQKLRRNSYVFWLGFLTVVLSFGWFFVDGNVGINLADEGFLWYGTKALKAGLVPIRDFQAYDPGRYVWTAAWSYLLGDGMVAMRAACVIFQCFGVLAGLLAVRRISRDWKLLLLIALVLVLWMLPRYKVFEQSISLMAIYVAVLVIEWPTARRHFGAGVFVGLMACMGRNHGLYLSCSYGVILVLLCWSRKWENFCKPALTWGAGIGVGYLPQLVMFAFTPGYFDAYMAQLRYDISIGTNLALPIPWPWSVPPEFLQSREMRLLIANYVAEGFFYLISPVFLIAALLRVLQLPRALLGRHAFFLAAACVSLSYTHHTFSRADYVHLAHSVPALVLGIVGLSATFGARLERWLPTGAAFTLSLLTAAAIYPHTSSYIEAYIPRASFVDARVAGETMHVPQYFNRMLMVASYVSEKLAKPEDSILFLPHSPGLYAATNRLSPTKQIYFMLPASAEEEEKTLAQIRKKKVRWVLLQDIPLDERDDLRFIHTNPIVTRYFRDNFEQIALPGLPANTVVLRYKE